MAMPPDHAFEAINDPEELRATIRTLMKEEVDIQMTLRDRERRLEAAALEIARVHDKYRHHGIRLKIHPKGLHNPSVQINQTEVFFCLPGRRGYDERSRWSAKIDDSMLSAIKQYAIESLIVRDLGPTGVWTHRLCRAGTNAGQACNSCRDAGRLCVVEDEGRAVVLPLLNLTKNTATVSLVDYIDEIFWHI